MRRSALSCGLLYSTARADDNGDGRKIVRILVTGADGSTVRILVTGADGSTVRILVTGADGSTVRILVTGADGGPCASW
jgi:hypothetical protein